MHTEVYVSGFSRALAVGAGLAALLALVGIATGGDLQATTVAIAGSALVALGAWALFWNPRVEVSDGGVRVVNVLRTVEVPWPVLVEARAAWSLEVVTLTRTWTAWAAPRSSGAVALARRGEPRPGRASAEAVAEAITARQEALLAAGHLDGARGVAERTGLSEAVTWHRGALSAALALAALAGVASAL